MLVLGYLKFFQRFSFVFCFKRKRIGLYHFTNEYVAH